MNRENKEDICQKLRKYTKHNTSLYVTKTQHSEYLFVVFGNEFVVTVVHRLAFNCKDKNHVNSNTSHLILVAPKYIFAFQFQ